jgi:hypothetical protein
MTVMEGNTRKRKMFDDILCHVLDETEVTGRLAEHRKRLNRTIGELQACNKT